MASAAPFCLHCTICFDEFNLTDKPPVILPCGHTYLCEPCSKRLRCCMECRSPLFVAPPRPPNRMSPSAFRHNKSRYSPTSSPRSSECCTKSPSGSNVPSPRQEKVQLPIPKNLVLIALMEAAQQTVKAEKRQDEDYESGDDDEQVVAGMNLLSSDFGTYAVREKNGLVVQPLSPSSSRDEEETQEAESHVHTSANVPPLAEHDDDFESFDLQDPVGVQVLPNNSSSLEIPFDERGSIEVVEKENVDEQSVFREGESRKDLDKKPFILRYGQTVQVVSFVDGKATLARRNGYIEASEKQLVKVGEAVDKACKIEGMLSSVASRKQALRRKLNDLDFIESELVQKLEEALITPDLDPFAAAPGFEELVSLSSSTPDSVSLNNNASSGTSDKASSQPNLEVGESAEFDNFVLSVTAAREEEQLPRSLPTRQILSPEPSQSLPYFGCTANIIPGLLSDDNTASTSPLYDVRRPRNSARYSGIDFRTGLSGHMALSSATAHVERHQYRREIRMMGEHRGIANVRRVRPTGSENSLDNPTW